MTTTGQHEEQPAAAATAPKASGMVADLGAGVLEMWRGGRDMYGVFVRTLYWTFRGRREKGAVWKRWDSSG
jgi:hypothetical protein